MIYGAKKIIQLNKNRRMGIVSSCNKKSAEFTQFNVYIVLNVTQKNNSLKRHEQKCYKITN